MNKISPDKNFIRRFLFAVASLLLVAAISIGTTVTLAWISENRAVPQNNVNMRLDASVMKSFFVDDDGTLIFATSSESSGQSMAESVLPGTVKTFNVGLANQSGASQTLEYVSIASPSVWLSSGSTSYDSINKDDYDEVPNLVDGEYYYLGTQLTAKFVGYKIYSIVTSTNDEGEETLSMGALISDVTFANPQAVSVLDMADPTAEIVLVTGTDGDGNDYTITLQANQMISLKIEIEFVDSDTEQNGYISYGTAGKSKFSRAIHIEME